MELKLSRITPLYAVREILGYGLAYLPTRSCIAEPAHAKAWMRAGTIELVVLAPKDWYDCYVGTLCERLELEWLVEAIDAGLDALADDSSACRASPSNCARLKEHRSTRWPLRSPLATTPRTH